MSRTRAFTLIELLVVVTIIVTLLAILLPSMGRAMRAAQITVCVSNLHQIGAATASYTSDHFGRFPARGYQTNTYTGGASQHCTLGKSGKWVYYKTGDLNITERELNAYVGGPYKDDDEVPVARCPSDEFVTYDNFGTSYVLNCYWPSAIQPGTLYHQKSIKEVRSPSRFVVYEEMGAWAVSYLHSFANDPAMYWHEPYPQPRFTMVFADGHAAAITVEPGRDATDQYTHDIDK